MEGIKRTFLAAVSATILLLVLATTQVLGNENMAGALAGGGSNLHMPFIPHNMLGGLGIVQGYVVDATTGIGIDGAEICTEFGGCFNSGVQGFYSISNIPLGYREFSAEADTGIVQYFELTRGIQVKGGPPNILNFALSPETGLADEGQYRVVVSWGDDPADLDAHLWTPDDIPYDEDPKDGILEFRPHVFSGHRGYCEPDPPTWPGPDPTNACLERDEVNGFGPETIKINEAQIGTYQFAVHKFEPACQPGPVPCPTPLELSGAIVQVYDSTGLRLFKVVPSSNPNNWVYWLVFEIVYDLNGEVALNEHNCFVPDPSPVDSPPVCPP